MSIKLTDTQLIVLNAAAQRQDHCLVFPNNLKGGVMQKFAERLLEAALVKEIKTKQRAPVWRRDAAAAQPYSLKLTAAGLKAIAVEADGAEAAEPSPAAPRDGSKSALVVALLRRDHGATLAELAAATGWLPHTTRAALTGLRRRGYVVALERSNKDREATYRIPSGSAGQDDGHGVAGEQDFSSPDCGAGGRAIRASGRPADQRRGDGEAEGSGALRHAQGGVMPNRRQANRAKEAQACPAPSSEEAVTLATTIAGLADLDADRPRLQWRNNLGGTPPAHLPRWLLARVLAYRLQAAALGALDKATLRVIGRRKGCGDDAGLLPFAPRDPATREGAGLKPGALLVRESGGRLERVMVLDKGFAWNGKTYGSLSQIAKAMTGTNWNGHRFFGLRTAGSGDRQTTTRRGRQTAAPASATKPAALGESSTAGASDENASGARTDRRRSAIVAIASDATAERLIATAHEAVGAMPPALAPRVVPDDELRGALPLASS